MLPQLHMTPDLVERVYDALLEGICSGELQPGERFTQEQLADRLGVSRQPVLQALLLLRQQGLFVDTENRRGVRVSPLEPSFVAGLYTVRSALDALAARSAAQRPRPELKSVGNDIIRRGRQASAAGDLAALVLLDLEFHRFLYEAAENSVLVDTAQLHWHHTRRVMAMYLRQPVSTRGIWVEHQAILNAVVKGDAKLAEKLSRGHAEQSLRLLFASLAGYQATTPAAVPGGSANKMPSTSAAMLAQATAASSSAASSVLPTALTPAVPARLSPAHSSSATTRAVAPASAPPADSTSNHRRLKS